MGDDLKGFIIILAMVIGVVLSFTIPITVYNVTEANLRYENSYCEVASVGTSNTILNTKLG